MLLWYIYYGRNSSQRVSPIQSYRWRTKANETLLNLTCIFYPILSINIMKLQSGNTVFDNQRVLHTYTLSFLSVFFVIELKKGISFFEFELLNHGDGMKCNPVKFDCVSPSLTEAAPHVQPSVTSFVSAPCDRCGFAEGGVLISNQVVGGKDVFRFSDVSSIGDDHLTLVEHLLEAESEYGDV